MINRLIIKNYQSHKYTDLRLHPGVNVIVGPSDSGKSVIIRAMNWVVNNKPTGKALCSFWSKATKVVMFIDDHKIIRSRDNADNVYRVDGKELKGFNKAVPEEVRQAVNLKDINIQSQMAPHFILTLSAGEVAKLLNSTVNLDIIDSSLTRINSMQREASSALKHQQELFSQYLAELKQYNTLDALEAELLEIEDIAAELTELNIEEKALFELTKELDKLNSSMNKYDSIDELMEELITLEKLTARIDKQQTGKDKLLELTNDLKETESFIGRTEDFIERRKQEINNLPKVCPTCGQEVDTWLVK